MSDKLLAKYITGDILPKEREMVIAWMKADERNEKYVEQLYKVHTTMIWTKQHTPEKIAPQKAFTRTLRRALPIAAMLAMAVFILHGVYTDYRTKQNTIAQTYTNLGGKSVVSLPDGSSVWIHSGSTLTHTANLWEDDRTVKLEGEAYFDVAHDKKHPFIVEVGEVKIKVHGTKFNIEALPKSDNIQVSLIEGSVSMNTKHESKMLHPGEIGTYNRRNHQIKVERGDVRLAASWANHEIAFKNKNITEIASFLSKWYGVTINISPVLQNRTYNYTFILRQEPLEEILRLMARIHPINYSFDHENVLTLTTKQTNIRKK